MLTDEPATWLTEFSCLAAAIPFLSGREALILVLQQIRDATHRFAITRHRRARTGAAMSGEIMRLPGIGPSTARLLWDAFSNFEAMQKATIADLQKLPGIGRTRAEALYAYLHGDTDTQRKN